jgi:hypothetical protein
MIIAIDQSPLWRTLRGQEDLSRLLEPLLGSRRGRQPASTLEVFLLACALECSEAAIGQHFAALRIGGTRLRLLPPKLAPAYSPTMPA